MCACDDSVSRTGKFRRSIDELKAWCTYRFPSQKFCAQNDVFLGVRVSFVLRLTLDKQIGMCLHSGRNVPIGGCFGARMNKRLVMDALSRAFQHELPRAD